MEKKLQSKIIKFLKEQGCYVIKTQAGPGVPVGCPDIIALYKRYWIAIEVKASAAAPFQMGQQMTLQRLEQANSFVYIAFPENWETIKSDLIARFL